ncbi:MAG: amidophosphoribosyltransferase, partial [Gammaproteobacteria bacterium CG_4_9_14_3_um_filter_38_9]
VLLCTSCITSPPPFHRTIALFHYTGPIVSLIWKLKFQNDLKIARLFAQHWIDYFNHFDSHNTLPDLIMPVPLHFSRLKQRGFNQSLEIAKPIGKYFHIPIDTRACIKIKNTEPQSSLSAQKRKGNLKNAFGLSRPIDAKHVAILDDVMTTGNTVSEIASLLQKTGVEKIDVWCCARA